MPIVNDGGQAIIEIAHRLPSPAHDGKSRQSCWPIMIRWSGPTHQKHLVSVLRIPRMSRICEDCTMNEMGDEMHLVFECPAVQHVRDQYAHLFTFATSTMRTFLWQDDINSVIKYVVACMDILG
jgi:hypothetical protein